MPSNNKKKARSQKGGQDAPEGRQGAWDKFTWKEPEDAEAYEGESDDKFFEGSMSFGLEELDGNSYKIVKNKGGTMNVIAKDGGGKKDKVKQQKEKAAAKKDGGEQKQDNKNKNKKKDLQEEAGGAANSREKSKSKGKDSKKRKNRDDDDDDDDEEEEEGKEGEEEASPAPLKADLDLAKYTNVPAATYAKWCSINLHSELTTSLQGLGFHTPTPIQSSSIPVINNGNSDVVGAAETGSGKTLAFSVPIINALLQEWIPFTTARIRDGVLCPYAMVIVPTRELAMQISSVVKEATKAFKSTYRVEVVTVVGGMSEQKQRRQLDGRTPVHILVATPGRLCELMEDESLPVFHDMSHVRFLVVDEADRIVEDGHFAEVHRIFSRIGDHENLAVEGKSPGQQKQHNGGAKAKVDYGMDVDEELIGSKDMDLDAMAAEVERNQVLKLDFEVPQELLPVMPTEEEIERARREQTDTPYNEDGDDDDDEDDEEGDGGDDTNVEREGVYKKYKNKRQTLLFSATALRIKGLSEVHDAGRKGGKKKKKKLGPLPGLTAELSEQLPDHVHQLMRLVGKRPKVDIVDVTSKGALSTLKGSAAEKKEREKEKKSGEEEDGGEEEDEEEDEELTNSLARNLPKQLVHKQMNSPAEEKDVFAYAYLHVHPSERVLIFVNSIKTARRLDGLLRALNLNCRVIHAQLQQKQRLKALESFQASTSGILVATDVAARGLDIPNVDVVLHYDVARSSQVYIHRSGRTARANRAGASISLVSPEDHMHHSAIVNVIGKAKLKGSGEEGKMTKTDKIKARLGGLLEHTVDTASLPVLRQRCALAKKIFLQSFLQGQQQKDSAWLQQTSKEAGIDVDADLAEELGGGSNATDSNSNLKGGGKGKQQQQTKVGGKMTKKELDRLRWELRQMLAQPVGSATSGAGSRRKGFFVVNGGMQ